MSHDATFSAEADRAARERLRTSLDESLLVEAAAGTGKTTMLVARLVAVLARGLTTVDRVVAVTFTRKAAGELQLRLRQELDRERAASADAATRERLADAIARLEEAHIGTIHSFCASLLHERPVEAGVDPDFLELDETEARNLYDTAFQTWIERRLDDLPEGLRRALARLGAAPSADGSPPIERLREAGRSLVEWRDFDAPWQTRPWDRAAAVRRLAAEVEAFAGLRRRGAENDPLAKATAEVASTVATLQAAGRERLDTAFVDQSEAAFAALLRALRRSAGWSVGRNRLFAADLPRAEVVAARDALLASLEDFERHAGADLAVLLRAELGEVLEVYAERKRLAGRLDFLDLLVRCRDLLRERAEVRAELQARFSHLFVDELQDIDPLQAEILLLLAADDPAERDAANATPTPGKLLLVGDPKQSIYRFRRADVVLYQQLAARLAARGVGIVRLSRSFRAVRPLQLAVNAAFAPAMQEDLRAGQPAYVPLLGDRGAAPEQPTLVALPVPEPFGWRQVTKTAIETSLPDAVAAWVDWLVHASGWSVQDPERPDDPQARVPVAPRHVCLLFRRFLSWGDDATAPYQRAFEARGVPHLLVGGRSLYEREEVETLRAALAAVEWPDDTLSVYATLRGDLFAFTDATLLRYRHQVGPLDPFAPPPASIEDPELAAVAEALAFLARCHEERNQLPVASTLLRLLDHTRAQVGLALRPAGNQVLANVQQIVALARAFAMRGGLSFRAFVELLDAEAARPGAGQAPALEEGAEGVRMMTVHAAKGLEFPVVVLADLTTNATGRDAGLHVDTARRLCAQRLLGAAPWELHEQAELELERDRAESVRIAYVAATRARDLLVVPALGTGAWSGGWLAPLDALLRPPHGAKPEPVPGAPLFGPSTVLEPRQDPHQPVVRPGFYRGEAGFDVAWWDPNTLRLGVEGDHGIRRWRLLAENEAAEAIGLERWLDWRSAREATLAQGRRPSHDVLAVTEAEQDPPGEDRAIEVATLARAAGRPHGLRFGTLVHTVLRDVPFDADRPLVAALARHAARAMDAPPGEVDAAVDAVAAALGHPVFEAVRQAESVLRESPFLLRLDGGFLIEGTFDLAFRRDGTWTVIDYKTDLADLAADDPRLAAYRRQLGWYVYALRQLREEPAVGLLLGV